jgi:hypothetical protein
MNNVMTIDSYFAEASEKEGEWEKSRHCEKQNTRVCPRFEAPNAITITVSSGPTLISGKTAISRSSQTTKIAITIRRDSAAGLTAATAGGRTFET